MYYEIGVQLQVAAEGTEKANCPEVKKIINEHKVMFASGYQVELVNAKQPSENVEE